MRIARSALLGALNHGTHVVPAKTSWNVLQSALIEPTEGGVVVHVTNQEMGLSHRLAADDVPRKAFLAPVARLVAILKTCSDETITLTPGGSLVIEADGARWDVPQLAEPQAFPMMTPPGGPAVWLPRADLAAMLARVAPMAERTGTRLQLQGVHFEFTADGRLVLTATDSSRLATGSVPCVAQGAAIIAGAHVRVLQHLLDEHDGEVAMRRSGALASFGLGDATLTCTLVAAEYPDYRQVLPRKHAVRATVDAEALRSALSKLLPVAPGMARGAQFTLDADAVTMESRGSDGEAVVRVPAEIEGATPVTIWLSVPYLLSLAAATTDRAVLGVTDERSPVTMRNVDDSDTWIGVLMPVLP